MLIRNHLLFKFKSVFYFCLVILTLVEIFPRVGDKLLFGDGCSYPPDRVDPFQKELGYS